MQPAVEKPDRDVLFLEVTTGSAANTTITIAYWINSITLASGRENT